MMGNAPAVAAVCDRRQGGSSMETTATVTDRRYSQGGFYNSAWRQFTNPTQTSYDR